MDLSLGFVTWICLNLNWLPAVTGVMHEADDAYAIRSTWSCYWLDQFLTLALNILILSIFYISTDLSTNYFAYFSGCWASFVCSCHSILECCIMFSGVKLSIRSLVLLQSSTLPLSVHPSRGRWPRIELSKNDKSVPLEPVFQLNMQNKMQTSSYLKLSSKSARLGFTGAIEKAETQRQWRDCEMTKIRKNYINWKKKISVRRLAIVSQFTVYQGELLKQESSL